MNRKGSTLSNWIFLILFLSLFLVVFQTQVLNPMNDIYGKNYSVGLSDDALENINAIDSKRSTANNEMVGSEVTTSSEGITLLSIGSVAKGIYQTVVDFASGRFLSVLLTDQLDMPPIVARVLTILIWISLIFVMIRIFMRGITP